MINSTVILKNASNGNLLLDMKEKKKTISLSLCGHSLNKLTEKPLCYQGRKKLSNKYVVHKMLWYCIVKRCFGKFFSSTSKLPRQSFLMLL